MYFAHVFDGAGGIMAMLGAQLITGIWLLSWAVTAIKGLTKMVGRLEKTHRKTIQRLAMIETRCAIYHGDAEKDAVHFDDNGDEDDNDER